MEISKIGNNQLNITSADTMRDKAADDDFEKHLQGAMNQKDEKELKKVCKEFESVMLNMMYKQMRSTVPKSELIPEDQGTDIFQSMLDDQLMEEASKNEGIGLADMLYKQLSKQMKSTYKPVEGEGSKKVEQKK